MHPALSVIVFTAASGAGYGLLIWLCLFVPVGLLPADRWFGAVALVLGLGLVTGGLLSSTSHLGHPERAWRALSQWRSSWLSREGVAALATYGPVGLFAIGWVLYGQADGVWGLFGVVGAGLALVTVYCTAMIYRSLPTIHQWDNGWVVPLYLLHGLATGALWLAAVVGLFGAGVGGIAALAAVMVALAWAAQLGYWRFIDSTRHRSTPETATGLVGLGPVRLLEAPHTQENYLMREMGYKVARKHAAKLRRISLAGGVAASGLGLLAALAGDGIVGAAAAVVAMAVGSAAVLVQRWLFFAEARHVVTLYYGADAA